MLVTPPNLPMNNKDGFPWFGLLLTTAIVGLAVYAHYQIAAPKIESRMSNKKRQEEKAIG